ncbi:MAG: hypothetical protein HFH14_06170 [Lachnospiraceae bacterium]|nr:hypothetical protein [Lachnospiraceae bacterium]
MVRKKREERRNFTYDRDVLWNVIKNVKIPILTLDERWNTLFAELIRRPEIKKKTKLMNELLKEQGGMVNRVKEMKVLKKRLMTNIVDNMSEIDDKDADNLRGKKQDVNQRLIRDINGKLEDSKERLMELPYEIMQNNRELLLESMIYGYTIINDNEDRAEDLASDIERLSLELEEKTKQKELIDKQTNALYSYLHDMIGADILEKLDSKM